MVHIILLKLKLVSSSEIKMPGRKKLAVSKLFEDVSTSDNKVPRAQCKFCQSSIGGHKSVNR